MASKYLHKRIWHNTRWLSARVWMLLHPNVTVVAVAGSVGKTTTKDLVAAVLSEHKPTVKSRANFDPIFNLPQTALRIRNHSYFVAEMGIDGPGQMSKYLELISPKIAVMTELSLEHTDSEHLSSLDVAIEEEWKLIDALLERGLALLNGDNPIIRQKADSVRSRKLLYGFESTNDVRIVGTSQSIHGTTPRLTVELEGEISGTYTAPFLGQHNALAITAAVIIGCETGMSQSAIQAGLNTVVAPPHRLEIKLTDWGILIDDTYNSSPKAAMAAIDTLSSIDPDGVLVLGDMLELGDYTHSAHVEVGEYARKQQIKKVLVYGSQARAVESGYSKAGKSLQFEIASSRDDLAERIKEIAPRTVLIKASRGMKLDEVVTQLSVTSE